MVPGGWGRSLEGSRHMQLTDVGPRPICIYLVLYDARNYIISIYYEANDLVTLGSVTTVEAVAVFS